MSICYLALGSNLDNPSYQVTSAFEQLHQLPHSFVMQASRLYQNPSLISGQPDFINAVVKMHTHLTPLVLLQHCKALEAIHHRIHYYHWGPRTLDIDILLYDNLQLNHEKLIIPHPQLCQRDFVLIPLSEIAPTLMLPDGSALQHYVAAKQITPI